MNAFRLKLFSVAVLFITSAIPSSADWPARPFSYTKSTANGEYVFAMIAPDVNADRYPYIRETFPVSGLYKKDKPSTPIWTVDWYSFEVCPASNGVHLVCPGPFPMNDDYPAVSFYANGQLIREYKVKELVTFPLLMPRTASHFFWSRNEVLNDVALTYTITTLHFERYVFDMKTGEMVSSFSLFRVLALFAVGSVASGGLLLRRRRRKRLNAD